MKTSSKLWKNFYKELGQIDPNNPMLNPVVRKAMTPSEYPRRAKLVVSHLKAGDSILEIGCGYGGLATEILKLVDVSYTVVDNKAMLIQAKRNLGSRMKYITSDRIELLRNREFTMFISHFCLSETPHQYREYILKNIMKNCQKIDVFDFDDSFEPTPKMISIGLEILPLTIEYYINKYFSVEKIPSARSRFRFVGERRE